MKSSDDGEKTLKNLVKFKKKWYYRLYVKDIDWNENYIQFNVGNISEDGEEIDGFTSSELKRVKDVYKNWNNMVNQMKRLYPSLKKDTYWKRMSDGLYENMEDLIDGNYGNFDDYDNFEKDFDDWYNYTVTKI